MTESKDLSVPDKISGYSQVRLDVDLTNGTIKETKLSPEFCRDWIGGYGFAAKVLWDELKPGIDPLSPENLFIYAHGSFPTTILPTSSKYGVFAKSPLTGAFGMAISSGSVAAQARRAGINMIVFHGKAPEPMYMVVDDDDRYLESCKRLDLWGKGCWDTEEILREEFQDQRLAVMSIGQAGERMSHLACLTNDRNRQAGRTGMGAVMGSKNLKAIAFRGTQGIKVAKPAEFYKLAKKLIKVANGPATAKYRDQGTPAGLLSYNKLGMFPVNNHREGQWDKIDEIVNGEVLNEEWIVKKVACSQCSIACDHLARVPRNHPDYPNLVASVDVELVYGFGTSCGNYDWPTIFKCITLCDDLGIDAISGGATAAMACDLFTDGLITKEELGYELPFGSTKNLVRFTEEMILGKGFAGEIFGHGTRVAGQKLEEMGRKGASKYGIHIKGLEFPAFDIHGMSNFAVGISVSIRGACHLRNGAYGMDTKGTYDRLSYDKPLERGKEIKKLEDVYAIIDSFIICKFTRGIYENDAEMAKAYELVTGIPMTEPLLMQRGEAILNLSKCFNIREGLTRADDHPPERFFTIPHTRGPNKGVLLKEDGFQTLLSGYYEARGWDKQTGIPTDAKLKELGMDFVIGKLKPAGGKK